MPQFSTAFLMSGIGWWLAQYRRVGFVGKLFPPFFCKWRCKLERYLCRINLFLLSLFEYVKLRLRPTKVTNLYFFLLFPCVNEF
jgi:hypothetical protein